MVKKQITIEDLAKMVQKGFDGVDKKFEGVDKKFDGVDKKFEAIDKRFDRVEKEMKDGFKKVDDRFRQVNARLDIIEGDIRDFVGRDEFEDVLSRLKLVEKTLGLKV